MRVNFKHQNCSLYHRPKSIIITNSNTRLQHIDQCLKVSVGVEGRALPKSPSTRIKYKQATNSWARVGSNFSAGKSSRAYARWISKLVKCGLASCVYAQYIIGIPLQLRNRIREPCVDGGSVDNIINYALRLFGWWFNYSLANNLIRITSPLKLSCCMKGHITHLYTAAAKWVPFHTHSIINALGSAQRFC